MKNVKRSDIVSFWYKVFVHFTQFADGFRRKNIHSMESIERFKMLENIK